MISKCKLLEPFCCKDTDKIAEVARKLHEFQQRHIYVVNADDYPVGIISISDLLHRVLAQDKNPADLQAKDVMTKEICIFDDNDDAREAYKAMSKQSIVSCAVVQDKKFIGILTFNTTLNYVTNPDN